MTCKYCYREGEKEFGEYQCEVEDFKKFFKNRKKTLDSIVVKLSNGDVWIYYVIKKFDKGYWQKVKSPKVIDLYEYEKNW